MLLLVLALHAASVATPPPEPQRTHQKRTVRKARKTRKARRTRVSTARINILAPACRTPTAGCGRDRNEKYRVAGSREEYDPKARALKGPFANCGVTGMPVCPSHGQTILTTTPE